MKSFHKLLLICLGALILRLLLLPLITHPGIGDPNHYYNLARRLVEDQGFTINYIWQFYNPPQSIVHPEDFWMPLTSVLASLLMPAMGQTVQAAILPFAILGSLLPVISYVAARQLECSETACLFAAGFVAVLPELLLNSLRTDTTIPNTLLVTTSILLLTAALRRGRWWLFLLSGLAAGLAYLTRGDNLLLLPMLIVTLLAYWLRARNLVRWRYTVLMPLAAVIVITPWIIRNIQVGGTPLTPNLDRLFFLVDFRDHYAYNQDFNFQTLLASQTPAQIIGKRLFEMAASVKILYTTLDVFLPVVTIGGFVWLLLIRARDRFLTLAPILILLGGTYIFYTILAPVANQGGSFKKAYLSLIPLLIPVGMCWLDHIITQRRNLLMVGIIALGLTTANAVELMRADIRFVTDYVAYIRAVVDEARDLGDANGDGEIILMAQDPFMLGFFDMQSVMIPMADRDTVLEVARRYGTDYLMMPPARPSLDSLYEGQETDPRFVPLRRLPAIQVELYGFEAE